MIQTKKQLLSMAFEGYDIETKPIKRAFNTALRMPEIDFLNVVKNELNFNVETVRKNLYIVR